ncbi:MAG: porin [Spirochaetota bacterium]|nr:porin [Spirochaetota bacterium]
MTKKKTLTSLFFAMLMVVSYSQLSFSQDAGAEKFKPTLSPTGRVQSYYDANLHETGITDQANKGGSQFIQRRIRLGAKGNVLEEVKYLVLVDINGKDGSNIELRYGWFDVALMKKVFNVNFGLLNAPMASEGISSGVFLFNDISPVNGGEFGNITLGAKAHGYVADMLGYALWVANGRHDSGSTGAATFDNLRDYGALRVGARFQIDPLGEWRHGREWLHRDTRAKLGVSFDYQASRGDLNAADAFTQTKSGVIKMSADIGFAWNILYVQGAFNLMMAKEEPSGTDYENYMGWHFDIAVSATDWAVPAVRIESYNDNKFYLPGEYLLGGAGYDTMTLAVGVSLFPWVSKQAKDHTFKIIPEFRYDLVREKGGSDLDIAKRMVFRLGATLNF